MAAEPSSEEPPEREPEPESALHALSSAASDADRTRELQERIAVLEAHLARRSAEVRQLRLQVDVFSTTDGATGLANRNGMADLIELALARLERRQEPFAIVAVGFPALEADDVSVEDVQHVSALVTAGLRRMDRAARIDHAVLAAVLPDLTVEHVAVVERRLRSLLSASFEIDLDARIGVVLVDAASTLLDPVALLERADRLQAELAPGRTAIVTAS